MPYPNIIFFITSQSHEADLSAHDLRYEIDCKLGLEARSTQRYRKILRSVLGSREAKTLKYLRVVNDGLKATQIEGSGKNTFTASRNQET